MGFLGPDSRRANLRAVPTYAPCCPLSLAALRRRARAPGGETHSEGDAEQGGNSGTIRRRSRRVIWNALPSYVRQSTLAQVRDPRGRTQCQYGQRALARELGWTDELTEVVDDDPGKSGTTSESRGGLQRLVADVAMGQCRAVFGVEPSRLSRSNADWHRLLDLCAAPDTLVIDDGRVHDPSAYDDRLLLRLKGTMADSAIHVLLSRMPRGRYRKALRGEHWSNAPVGYVRAEENRLLKDPDERVRHSVAQFFKRYDELGSADAVVRDFTKRGMKFLLRGRSLEAITPASSGFRREWSSSQRSNREHGDSARERHGLGGERSAPTSPLPPSDTHSCPSGRWHPAVTAIYVRSFVSVDTGHFRLGEPIAVDRRPAGAICKSASLGRRRRVCRKTARHPAHLIRYSSCGRKSSCESHC